MAVNNRDSALRRSFAGWTAVSANDHESDAPQLPAHRSTGSFSDQFELSGIQYDRTSDEKQSHEFHKDSQITIDQIHHAQDGTDPDSKQRPHPLPPPLQRSHYRTVSSSTSTGLLGDDSAASTAKKARARAVENFKTLVIITGGWGFLVIGCIVFKVVAMAVNLRTTDGFAELQNKHPQTATQFWTMVGNILGEVCLVLWSMSISYMAFRAVVFSKDKVELLTIAAWTELSRAGYTFSRRRVSWPIFTLIIWLGALFLAPGFTTLLTPAPIVYDTPYQSFELDQLSSAFSDQYLSIVGTVIPKVRDACSGAIAVFNSSVGDPNAFDPANQQAVQVCVPSVRHVGGKRHRAPDTYWANTLALSLNMSASSVFALPPISIVRASQASGAGVQALIGSEKPYFTYANKYQFPGRTWGVVPLGVNGLEYLSDADLRDPPPNTPQPEGYDHTYELWHQGLTTNVSCHRMTAAEQALIKVTVGDRADERNATVECPVPNGEAANNVSTVVVAPGAGTSIPNTIMLPCILSNGTQASTRTHTVFIKILLPNDEAPTEQNSLVMDTTCVFTPYWHTIKVTYPSDQNVLSMENSTFQSYIDRLDGGVNAAPAQLKPDNMTLARNVIAGANFLSSSSVVTTITNSGSGFAASNFSAVNGLGILSGNLWLVTLMNAVSLSPAFSKGDNMVPNEVIAASLQAMFDYESTADRSFAAAKLRVAKDQLSTFSSSDNLTSTAILGLQSSVILDDHFHDPAVARSLIGTWHAQTLGWGAGTGANDLTSSVVFFTLIPLFFFAAVSWGLTIWAHFHYRTNRGYYGAFNPTDITESIIAASAGGLMNEFDRRALSDSDGLYGARKVKVRLGRVLDINDPEGLPRLGFVRCD
ncbi:hypothetical protein OC845_005134 [Tilletia horrida]|nr:hypothetical protein OC845_005134 [Tilletia horrida]